MHSVKRKRVEEKQLPAAKRLHTGSRRDMQDERQSMKWEEGQPHLSQDANGTKIVSKHKPPPPTGGKAVRPVEHFEMVAGGQTPALPDTISPHKPRPRPGSSQPSSNSIMIPRQVKNVKALEGRRKGKRLYRERKAQHKDEDDKVQDGVMSQKRTMKIKAQRDDRSRAAKQMTADDPAAAFPNSKCATRTTSRSRSHVSPQYRDDKEPPTEVTLEGIDRIEWGVIRNDFRYQRPEKICELVGGIDLVFPWMVLPVNGRSASKIAGTREGDDDEFEGGADHSFFNNSQADADEYLCPDNAHYSADDELQDEDEELENLQYDKIIHFHDRVAAGNHPIFKFSPGFSSSLNRLK